MIEPIDSLTDRLNGLRNTVLFATFGTFEPDSEDELFYKKQEVGHLRAIVYGVNANEYLPIVEKAVNEFEDKGIRIGGVDLSELNQDVNISDYLRDEYAAQDLLIVENFDRYLQYWIDKDRMDAIQGDLRDMIQKHAKGFIGIVNEIKSGDKNEFMRPLFEGVEFDYAGGKIYSVGDNYKSPSILDRLDDIIFPC